MSKFASGTEVPVEKSRMEIERTLMRYGAKSFGYHWDAEAAIIGFTANGKEIRFELLLPDRENFKYTPQRGTLRSPNAVTAAWEQECRRQWRALHLVIKAKLEAVETGITTFETEFLPFIVLPNGNTVGQELMPRLEQVYKDGMMPGPLRLANPQGGGHGAQ